MDVQALSKIKQSPATQAQLARACVAGSCLLQLPCSGPVSHMSQNLVPVKNNWGKDSERMSFLCSDALQPFARGVQSGSLSWIDVWVQQNIHVDQMGQS
jgi:hypothetical protein